MIDKEDLKEIYLKEFNHDPVYRLVVDSKLEGYLYPESLLSIELEKTYSTIEVGRMIGRKDSTIRNYFNTELVDYIIPEKVGNLYRLNYINVLKIHMISLLYEKGGKNKSQIAYELGMKGSVKIGKEDVSSPNLMLQNKELEKIKQYLSLERIKNNWLAESNELQQIRSLKQEKQLEYNTLEIKKDRLLELDQQRENEERYIKAITDALQTVSEKEQKNRLLLEESNKKKGFLSIFTRKSNNEQQEDITSSNHEIELLKKESVETKEQKEKRDNDIKNIDKQLVQIYDDIKQLTTNINKLEDSIQEKKLYFEKMEHHLIDGYQNDKRGELEDGF
ncbi:MULTISPECIES: hypothetical protein [Oceanobacillus]|uniref:Uncharacterized protein n=1 Tax=Oceanobacillus kimchii TaxID=746691 RepID=A0ABQ5TQ17_9BACI|nr:hypothetical protein [Oceanobacillus kimchii]GLO68287.1 hypothetical protein MACH08_40710 [Oceanobacillus kimchii]